MLQAIPAHSFVHVLTDTQFEFEFLPVRTASEKDWDPDSCLHDTPWYLTFTIQAVVRQWSSVTLRFL